MRLELALAGWLALSAAGQQPVRPAASTTHPGATGRSALDKAVLEAYLRQMELWPLQIQVRIGDPKPFIRDLYEVEVHLSSGPAAKDVLYYVSADGKTILSGTAHNIDRSPFQSDLDRLKLEHHPTFGPANAPLTLAVFSDFECPVCREEAKELREKIPLEFPKELRVVFADFPLEAIHPWAKPAALAGRCVYRVNPTAFWDFHDWMFEHQPEIKVDNLREKVVGWAKSKSVDDGRIGECFDSRGTEAEVNAEIAMAKQLQIDSTPTLFLNGRRLAGHVPWQNLSQIIKLELEFQKRP